jgi:hypothetical protein
MRLTILLSSFILFTSFSKSQPIRTGKWGIEASYQVATFIKHSPKIIKIPSTLSHNAELSFFHKTFGSKPWHKPLNYPEVGGAVGYFRFGDNKVFGDAYTILGTAKFYLFRSKYVNGFIRIGGGFGFLTRYHDYITNPQNNIVSSVVNLAVQFRTGLEFKPHPQFAIQTAFNFTHYSNSAATVPNYGINIIGGSIGIKVYPKLTTEEYDCTKKKPKKRNEVMARYQFGLQQVYGQNGPIYPVHGGSIVYLRYLNSANKIFGGFAVEYLQGLNNKLVYNDTEKDDALRESIFPSLLIGDEIILGKASMLFALGVYLTKNKHIPYPVYAKVGGNYYFAEFGKDKGYKFFVGTAVKSHLQVAQYWEFSSGVCF